ncbi:MAG: glycoside hydrolase family 16 protein [Clostridia bacterium]|nr:glycoside hydrolase family 16 protein [Clostridia bacterium]
MKRLISILIAALMILGVLVSCGEVPTEPASDVSSESEQASAEPSDTETGAPDTESETEPGYQYIPPEDGSFTVCGIDLSEYSMLLYFEANAANGYLNRSILVKDIERNTASCLGYEKKLTVVKNDRFNTTPKSEHEILFGNNFHREGIPELDLKKNCYGVTADGTIYFSAPSHMLYGYLWRLFLEEFFGYDSSAGEKSAGCALTECYRELPELDLAKLEASGYSLVFADEFDGDSLDMDVWDWREPGPRFEPPFFDTTSLDQVVVKDGILTMIAKYREDGEFGPGYYGVFLGLRQYYCRGYFEARIKCSYAEDRSPDYASAFWIEGDDPYHAANSQMGIGPGGTEIDIMENFGPDYHTCCFWASGAKEGDALTNEVYHVIGIGNNYLEEYHTYSLLWDEDAYTVYLDGMVIAHSSFLAGTATVGEQVLLSLLCCSIDETKPETRDVVREMKVDYVRIWQK